MILTDLENKKIQKEMKRFEDKRSAIIPALYIVQGKEGWVSVDAIEELSTCMNIPSSDILEVRNFYTMFNQKPMGKLHVQVCTNVSCTMNGGKQLTQKICDEYGVKLGEVSSCGKVTVSRVECLGACDKAPMMQVNDQYYESLTNDSALKILEEL